MFIDGTVETTINDLTDKNRAPPEIRICNILENNTDQ